MTVARTAPRQCCIAVSHIVSDSITSICCGFVVGYNMLLQQAVYTTNPQQIESLQQVVEQTASLTTSWTTCRTASYSYSKLHATISKSYSKSHNLLYDKSTANRIKYSLYL